MKLTRRHLEPGALTNYTQVSHRRTAIEYAVAGTQKLHAANIELLGSDPFNKEMEGTMRKWVIEALLQGAYLREYHLWEKDCKAYFSLMAKRNGQNLAKPKGGQRFTDTIRDALSEFAVTISDETMSAIDRMRDRVNVMKHDAGLSLDHFIEEADYVDAVVALENFWETLASFEEVQYGR